MAWWVLFADWLCKFDTRRESITMQILGFIAAGRRGNALVRGRGDGGNGQIIRFCPKFIKTRRPNLQSQFWLIGGQWTVSVSINSVYPNFRVYLVPVCFCQVYEDYNISFRWTLLTFMLTCSNLTIPIFSKLRLWPLEHGMGRTHASNNIRVER